MNTFMDGPGCGPKGLSATWLLSPGTATLAHHDILSEDQERRLAEKAAKGCEKSRQQLVQSNFRLVFSIARRYASPAMPLEDLVQEGQLGLVRAADRYDLTKGCRFATYASWWIRQAILRAIQDHGRTIRVPAHLQDARDKVWLVSQSLEMGLGRKPTVEEVVRASGLTFEAVRFWLEHSLETVAVEGEVLEKASVSDADAESDPERIAMRCDEVEKLETCISHLSDREQQVIRLRFGLEDQTPHSLSEVATEVKVTRERVRQIEISALRKLRALAMSLELSPAYA